MWFSLFAAVLVLAVTFFVGLQGLFSGLINCVLAIISAALSFALYEDLYYGMLREWQPDHGRAIALLSIFILSLLILRTLFDAIIKDNMQFPVYVDRAGGGLFGFFTGMIVVGMLSIGFQMLPFGDSVMGYSRQQLTDTTDNKPIEMEKINEKDFKNLKYVRSGTWLKQDQFTLALISHLSANSLQGRQVFADAHPNFLDEAYFAQARLYKDEMPTASPKLTIKVDNYWDVPDTEFRAREKKETPEGKKQIHIVPCKDRPEAGNKRLAVRVSFSETGKLNFTAKQIRLVVADPEGGPAIECPVVGISDDKAGNRLVQVWDGEIFQRTLTSKTPYVDFVFEVPKSVRFGEGSFLEYKLNARAEMPARAPGNKKFTKPKETKEEKEASEENAGGEGTNKDEAGKEGENEKSSDVTNGKDEKRPSADPTAQKRTDERGRVSSIGKAQSAIVSNKLPFTFTSYGGSAEIKGGKVVGGQFTAPMTKDWQPAKGNQTPVDGIVVSDDMRLIQVNVEKLHAQSTLGRAKEFVSDKIADFSLIDSNGGRHPAIGVYALARVGGKPTFELMLLADEIERKGEDTFKKLPPLQKISRHDLVGEYELYYIFQVKPGTKAVKVDTGKTNQSVDLTEFNIEAK